MSYQRPVCSSPLKARWAIDCGADAVIGHHPHVLQALEIHRERPIFYSVGNFAFGSGMAQDLPLEFINPAAHGVDREGEPLGGRAETRADCGSRPSG